MKKFVLTIMLSLLTYSIIIYIFGFESMLLTLKNFSLFKISLAFFFLILSLITEFIRWRYYLTNLKINIPLKKDISIFFSGLALGVLPSKSGELLRYYLLKKEGFSYSKTIPVHFVSNISNLIVVLFFSIPLFILYGYEKMLFFIFLSIFILFLIFKFFNLFSRFLNIFSRFSFYNNLLRSLKSSNKLLKIKIVLATLFLTVLQYFFMFCLIYCLLYDLTDLSIIFVFSVYCISLILGAISAIPGGLGVIEGSNIFLLSNFIDPILAATFVVILRFLTLWVTSFMGLYFLIRDYGIKKLNFNNL